MRRYENDGAHDLQWSRHAQPQRLEPQKVHSEKGTHRRLKMIIATGFFVYVNPIVVEWHYESCEFRVFQPTSTKNQRTNGYALSFPAYFTWMEIYQASVFRLHY